MDDLIFMAKTEKTQLDKKPSVKTQLKRISTYVDEDTKRKFASLAISNDQSESEFLAMVVRTVLKTNKVSVDPVKEAKTGSFHLRLPKTLKVKVLKRAAERDVSPPVYVRSLLLASLNSEPAFTEKELIELREANRQLGSIGRNINQVAKAINISKDNAIQAALLDLSKFKDALEVQRKAVVALVLANQESWKASDEK